MCEGPLYVYGSYRGCGTCMGPTGLAVLVWVLQGCLTVRHFSDSNGEVVTQFLDMCLTRGNIVGN